MKLIDYYYKLPVRLQELALSAVGLRLRATRYGPRHEALVNRLGKNLGFDRPDMVRLRDSLLFDVMHFAASSVPFYQHHQLPVPETPNEATEVLKEWPIVTKSVVQSHSRDFVPMGVRTKDLSEIHTGGTTGRALAVLVSPDDLRRNYAFFERFKRTLGIAREDRVATFAGRPIVPVDQQFPPFWRHNFAANQLLMSSYHLNRSWLEYYVNALVAFRPHFIDSYPSSIEPIARWISEVGAPPIPLKAVITSSETLLPEVQNLVERAFGCRVYDHYGAAEMVALITQCDSRSYHINEDFGYVEILMPDNTPSRPGCEGQIVATGFVNRSMVLVRYATGDIGVVSDSSCDCSLPFPIVREIVGRSDDVVVTPDGRRVGRLDPIFKAVSSLHEARLVQERIDLVRLEIVGTEAFTGDDERTLLAELRLRLGDGVSIEVNRVSSIARSGRGKLRLVESRLST